MKIKNTILFTLLFAFLSLSGCQLALEHASSVPSIRHDLLIGVYITQTDGPDEPLYATLVDGKYRFDIEGVPFFSPITYSYDDVPAYTIVCDGMDVTKAHFATTGIEEEPIYMTEMEGTLTVVPEIANHHFSTNRVYQTPEGDVYMVDNTDIAIGHAIKNEQDVWSFTQEDSITFFHNEKPATRGVTFTITLATAFEPTQIVILQMDENSQIIARDSFVPGQLPESIAPTENAAYLIVETHKLSPDGETVIIREVYDSGKSIMHTAYAREDGVLVKQSTEIMWPNQ